ncbi:MAG: APC family permease [Phycisphaerae bacterium]|nr:APC family permease [Phycisphaerae bacterium]
MLLHRLKRMLFGPPRDVQDPKVFHKMSLVAFLAWVGLGADGLSSSAYGPDETFRALGEHSYLAVFLALATALTVFIISYAYSRIIEHFPSGGGGYLVATKLLGPGFGVVSGSALLVDYVLTISVSIASAGDQVFSFLPLGWHGAKVPLEVAVIVVLLVLNIRGAKESISLLLPIFMVFVLSHAVALAAGIGMHLGQVPAVAHQVGGGLRHGLSTLGLGGMLLLCARAYSRGAGTYTGIEAVSNGIQMMREPRVPTAKRTMTYMAVSLAVTAGGILLCYLLLGASPQPGKTMNAVMLERLNFGQWFVVLCLLAEGLLLVVAAQTGFIDGPRVMANMALDSWLPHRFSSLSERLTTHYGVGLIAGASVAALLYARGGIDTLVTMYSINVFITFSLTEMGMVRFWITGRRQHPEWKRALPIHLIGLTLCLSILTIVIAEKFTEGGWITILITSALIALCWVIRRHYRAVAARLIELFESLADVRRGTINTTAALDPSEPTAVLMVSRYGGLGIHALLNIQRQFPGYFKQVVFVSIAVVDSGAFKGAAEIDACKKATQDDLDKFVEFARSHGLAATSATDTGTDPVEAAEGVCAKLHEQFAKATFFTGKLAFQRDRWYQRILHNETAFAIQRRLQWRGLATVVLPIRVRD